MTIFIQSIIIVAGLGLLLGLILTLADKYISVPVDEKEAKILSNLSGANCGSCGYPGCSALAKAIAAGKADISLCPVASNQARQNINNLTGAKTQMVEPKVAFVGCAGGIRCADRGSYTGIQDCRAAANSGVKACAHACLGMMNCARVCPVDAIVQNEFGIPEINKKKCIGCGLCAKECPKSIITLNTVKTKVHVGCSSTEFGKAVKDVCSVGCIGCKLCEKVCPENAIKVVNNIPIIDNDICNGCNKCVDRCPTKTLIAQIS